jgi:hypothetical protein
MTLYLVRHGERDYRLHEDDGVEIYESWGDRPTKSQMASKLADGWRIETEGYNYRDLTLNGETVPWQ